MSLEDRINIDFNRASSNREGENTLAALAALAAERAPSAQDKSPQKTPTKDDSVDWRKSIVVVTDDPTLRMRIENYLDHLQNSPSTFTVPGKDGKPYSFTGKDMIRAIGLYVGMYNTGNGENYNFIRSRLKDGKLQIMTHELQFDGTPLTGAFTVLYGDVNLPLQIQIGKDYLKSMEFKADNGNFYPVTIEGVLLNEIAHAAFRLDASQEAGSNLIENQLLRERGWPERKLDMTQQESRINRKPNYTSLWDPNPGSEPAVAPAPAKPKP